MEKENKKRGMEQMLYTVLGGFLFAFGVNLIIMPMNLYNGGFMGVAQLLRTFVVSVLHIDLGSFDLAGIIYYMINIPLMYLAWKNIGKGFFVRTIISVTLQSVFLTCDTKTVFVNFSFLVAFCVLSNTREITGTTNTANIIVLIINSTPYNF